MATFVAYYATAPLGELVATIPIKRASDQGWTPIFALTVANAQQNDILTITGRAQATNNLHKAPTFATNNNVGLGSSLAYIDGQGAYQAITPWVGSNLDARQHHGPRPESTVWQVPAGVPSNLLIRFYMKSAALQAKANWSLRVDQGYGFLRILHERP